MANNIVSRITSAGTYFANGKFDEVSYSPTSGGAIAYSTTPKSSNPNLLISSNDYSNNTYWEKNNCSTTFVTATTAPDGTYTAQKFVEDSTSAEHWFTQFRSAFTTGQTATFSFYAKAAERSKLNLRFIGAINLVSLTVNLITGETSSVNLSPNGIGYSVTPVNNGWWRIVATGYADQSTLLGSLFLIQDSPLTTNYLGNGTSGIYVWGQQLEYGLSASNYVATDLIGQINRANTQLHRYTSDWNIVSWNTNRTNSNNTVTLTSATTAPDGSMTAYKFVANTGVDPNLSNSGLLVQQNGYGQITQGLVYTQSLFFKPAEFNTLRLRNNSDGSIYNFVAGTTPTATSGVLRPQLQDVGNGWYRASWSFVAQSIGGGGGRSDNWSYRLANTGDGTSGIYIWGPQLQLGNTLSPFIATSTPNTAINLFNTRTDNSGDVLTINDFDEVTYVNINKNLLTNSQNFTNQPPWFKTLVLNSSNNLAPNGTLTATQFTTTGVNLDLQYLFQPVTVTPETTYTASFYAKLGTMTSNQYLFAIYDETALAWIAQDIVPNVTLTSSEWNRVTYTFKAPTGCTVVRVYPYRSQSLGTAVVNFYLWGVQVELGTQATFYVSNPNKNLFRSTENITVSPWNTSAANVISTTELDPNGNYTATKFGNKTSNPNIKQSSIPVTPNTNYTISISAKGTGVPGMAMVSGNGTFFPNDATQFQNFGFGNAEHNTGGVFPNYLYSTMTPENNGYYRCSATVLTDATQNAITIAFWQGGYGYGSSGNTLTLFGPQLELGNTATPYQANTITLSSKTLNGGTIAVVNEIDEVTFNPPIVTANLTLSLDAASPNSYNGDNVWYDTSGNSNRGTLTGGVRYNSNNYGTMVFSGNTSGNTITFSGSTTGNTLGFYQSDFSTEIWFYNNINSNGLPASLGGGLFSLNGSAVAGGQYAIFSRFGTIIVDFYGQNNTVSTNSNTWYHLVHTYNYTTKKSILYINGVSVSNTTRTQDLTLAISTISPVVGFYGFGGSYWNGNIPVVRVYNKELSQAEINQNFKALAYRYNL